MLFGHEAMKPEAIGVLSDEYNLLCDKKLIGKVELDTVTEMTKMKAALGFYLFFFRGKKVKGKEVLKYAEISPEEITKARAQRWELAAYLDNVKVSDDELGLSSIRWHRRKSILLTSGIKTKAETSEGVNNLKETFLKSQNKDAFIQDVKYIIERFIKQQEQKKQDKAFLSFINEQQEAEQELREIEAQEENKLSIVK